VVVGGFGDDFRFGFHSSTLQEGVLRGQADVARSMGIYNRLTGEGAVYAAEAGRMALENYEQYVDTYHQTRQKAREYRAAERRPRATAEDLRRYSQRAAPDRLDASELHASSGSLTWPILLRDDAFASHRQTIDAFFYKRATESELSTADYLTAKETAGMIQSELKRRVRQVPMQEYAVAKRFLKSLNYEAQLPSYLPPEAATDVADRQPTPPIIGASRRTVRG
jgi:hypothetical protein